MWYEGHLQTWEEVSEETVEFFAKNEHLKPNYQGVDDPILTADDDINDIMDNTKNALDTS